MTSSQVNGNGSHRDEFDPLSSVDEALLDHDSHDKMCRAILAKPIQTLKTKPDYKAEERPLRGRTMESDVKKLGANLPSFRPSYQLLKV